MPITPIRHFFPGGNTPQGFFSYYDYVIQPAAKRIFILKGGPGTGKSTFMKRISAELQTAGFAVENHHCSSDSYSLDGVVMPELEIAVLDGTAPHIIDPKFPGCVDEILNLGAFWDNDAISTNKTEIISSNAKIKAGFQRSYRLLRAAKAVYDDWEIINSSALDIDKANKQTAALIDKIFSTVNTAGAGKIRKLFMSAITPTGAVNYLDSLLAAFPTHHIITGAPGTGKATLIQKLADIAHNKGLDIELFYCAFDPLKPEHLAIPALGTVIVTSAPPHTVATDTAASITSMDSCLKAANLNSYNDIIDYDQKIYHELFQQAVATLRQTKQDRDGLERLYIAHMNFDGIETLWQKTLQRILAYAK